MSQSILRPSDRCAIAAVVNPGTFKAGSWASPWVPVRNFEKLLAVVALGALRANAVVDAKLEQARNSDGLDVQDVAGKAISALSRDNADENKQALINFTAADMDANNDYTHVRLSINLTTAPGEVTGLLLGFNPRYGRASDHDADTVAEIV